jgi:hypothetical protein
MGQGCCERGRLRTGDDMGGTPLMIETWLNLFGLSLTGLGAFVAGRSVIISKEQAKSQSGTYWNGNEALRDALLAQSRSAP